MQAKRIVEKKKAIKNMIQIVQLYHYKFQTIQLNPWVNIWLHECTLQVVKNY